MIGQRDKIIERLQTLEQTGQYDTLLKESESYINDNPDLQPLYYYKGNALRYKGDMQGALAAYRWAILLDPNDSLARCNYAKTLFDLKDYVGALNAADATVLMKPNFPDPYLICGGILSLLGFPHQAMYPYHQAYEFEPENVSLGSYVAELYSQQDEPNDAFRLMMDVLAVDPDNFALQLQMASMLCFFLQNGVDLKDVKGWTAEWYNQYKTELSEAVYQNIMQQNVNYNPLSIQNLAHAFNEQSAVYDINEEDNTIAFINALENTLHAYLQGQKDMTVLDIGCGSGLSISPVREYISHGRLTGVDLSKELIKLADSRHVYTDLYIADAMEFLSDKTVQYDMIVAANSLPYFSDLDALFLAMNKALKVNGYVCFSIRHNNLNNDDQIFYPPYNYIFSPKYIRSLLKKNGFVIRSDFALQEGSDDYIHDKMYFYVVQKDR